jgi:hypothetical protein
VVRQFCQGDGVSIEVGGETMGALDGTVCNDDPPNTVLVQVAGGQLYGFTGADQERSLGLEVAKDLPCKADGGEGHGHRAVSDSCVRANLLGNGKSVLEQASQKFPGSTRGTGGLKRRFDLSENLGLAKHHRVQTAGDLQQVRHRVLLHVGVKIGCDAFRFQAVKAAQPVPDRFRPQSVQRAVNLGAVAGG